MHVMILVGYDKSGQDQALEGFYHMAHMYNDYHIKLFTESLERLVLFVIPFSQNLTWIGIVLAQTHFDGIPKDDKARFGHLLY